MQNWSNWPPLLKSLVFNHTAPSALTSGRETPGRKRKRTTQHHLVQSTSQPDRFNKHWSKIPFTNDQALPKGLETTYRYYIQQEQCQNQLQLYAKHRYQYQTNNNRRISDTKRDRSNEPKKSCNYRRKDQCPMSGKCQVKSIVCKAIISSENNDKEYICLTGNTFKPQFSSHLQSITHDKYEHSTELSKYVWGLKRFGENHDISWSVYRRPQHTLTSHGGANSVRKHWQ